MRNIEFDAGVLKADATSAGRRHLSEAKQILRFRKRHFISMPEIDTLKQY